MAEEKKEYEPPAGSQTAHTITLDGRSIPYGVDTGWLVLRKNEKPVAEVFHVYYRRADDEGERRAITFVFNGGPGAASAYLHVGALGPRRVAFREDGSAGTPPVSLVDNEESWLAFTDLVFVDPVGTGFSRAVPKQQEKEEKPGEPGEDREFWKIRRDLESLAEFISKFLSAHHRWDSPVFIAGESYGGYRTAKLARLVQESYGVGLNGVVLISPALEFAYLDPSDYDVLPWVDLVPSMAAAAAHHGRSPAFGPDAALPDILRRAESFATTDLPPLLITGDSLPDRERSRIARGLARLTGLEPRSVDRCAGRVSARRFARELLRDRSLVCGLYDATVTTADPFPDREGYEGPDPTLRSIERVFSSGINTHLRRDLAVTTDRDYHLLSTEVNRGWQVDIDRHALESQIGATDDLRYAMSLNPAMKVRISHGYYDLVTPYFASDRLARLMRLPDEHGANLSLEHYRGGHMFYAWEESRRRFSADMRAFYSSAQGIWR